MGNLNETPSANRLHIGIYGKTNSGKSSLINAVTKQEVSIVADVAGTTTDPVYKPMEIHPLLIRRALMMTVSLVKDVWKRPIWQQRRQT
jgi:tRNA U34 5-carboxymethylaminomethyl modifying GTPase MnmE/TrmE